MYAGDHNPPHFHVLCSNGQECSIALGRLTVLAGSVDAKYREAALAWARRNHGLLKETWKDLNS